MTLLLFSQTLSLSPPNFPLSQNPTLFMFFISYHLSLRILEEMAYAAVASLSQTIDILLNYHQHSISPRFKDQIISLHKHIIFFESFLEDFPDRANNWEETIRNVTDRAEDIIELLLSDLLLLESTVISSRSDLEQVNYDELERVAMEIESLSNVMKGERRTESVGVSDDELMEIISRLRGGSSSLEIIFIVGSGGSGKTTLAKNAYIHSLIVEHFDIRAWSTVTSEYIRVRMIQDLLRTMKAENYTSNSEDKLTECLYKNLCRRRYLLVLDDVWSFEVLERLKIMLPDYGNGSRIILTTRSFILAKSAGHIHRMCLLDEDKTWNLFRENIFKGDPCPSQLEHIGKEISRRCRGHPLTIKVISGILATDQTEAAWEEVSEDIKIASEDVGRELVQILYLSYTYLPHHLRPCFLYLGCFPEDRNILVSRLIKLWIAEGFVNQSECKSFEETGEGYVEDLVRRNLVSVSKWKCNGRIKSITIHDVLRDLCQRQAHIDNFTLHVERENWSRQRITAMEYKTCRRVSNLIYGFNFLRGVSSSTIRSIILYLEYGRLNLRCWMGNVRLLRILDLLNVNSYNLSVEVFELFHLRYLAFHCELSIPEAISNLQNLQTLIISPRKKDGRLFDNLPEGIWKMPQLRHLCIFRFKLPSQIGAMSALENLQTLSIVVDFICSRENLQMTPNLKKLALVYTKNLRDVVEDYELHNLIYLRELEILKIEMNLASVEQHKMSCALQFPPTLKKLNLCGMEFPWEDMKVISSLPNLEVLKLRKHAFVSGAWETSEGGFSELVFLLIEESNLEHWITETSHFPKLKYLVLHRCSCLLEVPTDMGMIPTLELIQLDDRSHSLLRSAKQMQEDRQSLGCDSLHIRVE